MVLEQVWQFILDYIWLPILEDRPYNPVDTTLWAVIFVIAVWAIYEKFIAKYKIKIDRYFMFALGGWIAAGGAARVLEDVEIVRTFLLITPFIYIMIFVPAIVTLVISRSIDKRYKVPYWKIWGGIGYALAAAFIFFIPLRNLAGLGTIAAIFFAWLALFVGLRKLGKRFYKPLGKFLSWWNIAAIQAHMLDASASFAAVSLFGFFEKHVLGAGLVAAYGSWTLFAMKLAVVPLAVWAIDRYVKVDLEARYLKMVIIILGFALGVRNTLAVMALG